MIICRKVKLSNLHTHKTWDMSVFITILKFPGTYSFFSWIRIRIQEKGLKWQCHEIFDLYIFSLIEPIWAPDKQAKLVLLKSLFLQRYSRKILLCAVLT